MTDLATVSLPHLTATILELNAQLDAGKSCDIAEVKTRAEDGSLFEWLRTNGVETLQLPTGEQGELLELFVSLDATVSERRKFSIEHNGYALVLAWFVEALQQCLAARGLYPI